MKPLERDEWCAISTGDGKEIYVPASYFLDADNPKRFGKAFRKAMLYLGAGCAIIGSIITQASANDKISFGLKAYHDQDQKPAGIGSNFYELAGSDNEFSLGINNVAIPENSGIHYYNKKLDKNTSKNYVDYADDIPIFINEATSENNKKSGTSLSLPIRIIDGKHFKMPELLELLGIRYAGQNERTSSNTVVTIDSPELGLSEKVYQDTFVKTKYDMYGLFFDTTYAGELADETGNKIIKKIAGTPAFLFAGFDSYKSTTDVQKLVTDSSGTQTEKEQMKEKGNRTYLIGSKMNKKEGGNLGLIYDNLKDKEQSEIYVQKIFKNQKNGLWVVPTITQYNGPSGVAIGLDLVKTTSPQDLWSHYFLPTAKAKVLPSGLREQAIENIKWLRNARIVDEKDKAFDLNLGYSDRGDVRNYVLDVGYLFGDKRLSAGYEKTKCGIDTELFKVSFETYGPNSFAVNLTKSGNETKSELRYIFKLK